MRIISGKFRRKSIVPPKNFKARPTTDMAKESLFNILENNYNLEQLSVLDLFSGTGSITYEFASRQCKRVTAVEMNFKHYTFIKKNIENLKINEQAKIIKTNVFTFLNKTTETYDIIFADPPYNLKDLETITNKIFENKLLNNNGLLVFEHSSDYDFSKHPNFSFHKKYGSVNFSFFC